MRTPQHLPMTMYWGAALALVVVWSAIAGGCRREPAVNGIGGFEIDKTQLSALSGRCIDAQEKPLMLCPGVAGVELGKQFANIDLYFADSKAEATLQEILLNVIGCDPAGLESFFSERLGPPGARTDKRVMWQNQYVFISVTQTTPTRCEASFVSINDDTRIKRLGGPIPAKE